MIVIKSIIKNKIIKPNILKIRPLLNQNKFINFKLYNQRYFQTYIFANMVEQAKHEDKEEEKTVTCLTTKVKIMTHLTLT